VFRRTARPHVSPRLIIFVPVKIVFLCTSLAPGRDGVGDYVRELAAACVAAGHVCLLVAVHDRHLTPSSALFHRKNEIRFAAGLSWKRRTTMLANLLREFDPHWVSWQVVPYGFHPKGILPAGSFGLVNSVRAWPNHVTLHELWLGLARSDHLRSRLIGVLQRRKLLAFLRRLRPAALHTTNAAYQLALARRGWPAELLPLFGNIPVLTVNPQVAKSKLADLVGDSSPAAPWCVGVIFGTIHPQWKPAATLAWLKAAALNAQRRICLLAVGRPGAHGAKLLAQLARNSSGIRVISVGPQSPEILSHLLQAADFGLATHPWALIEKSGTTVSLLEHGLPVLVPRDDWESRDGNITAERDPLLRKMSDLSPTSFAEWLKTRRAPAAQLPEVAASFLAQLSGPAVRGALVA
jgi:hypothetical protein